MRLDVPKMPVFGKFGRGSKCPNNTYGKRREKERTDARKLAEQQRAEERETHKADEAERAAAREAEREVRERKLAEDSEAARHTKSGRQHIRATRLAAREAREAREAAVPANLGHVSRPPERKIFEQQPTESDAFGRIDGELN